MYVNIWIGFHSLSFSNFEKLIDNWEVISLLLLHENLNTYLLDPLRKSHDCYGQFGPCDFSLFQQITIINKQLTSC